MIQAINYSITRFFDLVLYPFQFLGDFWAILFLSVLVSLVVLIIYKYISSPIKIKKAKNQIKSSILAIRLYKDFWKVIAGSFFKSLLYTLKYFILNFGPVLIIIPLLFPLFVQMDVRYGMRPFRPGEVFPVKAVFNTNVNDLEIRLLENNLFRPEMNPVFINAYRDEERSLPIREVNWKLRMTGQGATDIQVRINDRVFGKNLVSGKYAGALSNKKFRHSSADHFFYPVEKLFANNQYLESMIIHYPAKSISFLGIRAHWLVYHLILVLIMVLALRKRFGVEF